MRALPREEIDEGQKNTLVFSRGETTSVKAMQTSGTLNFPGEWEIRAISCFRRDWRSAREFPYFSPRIHGKITDGDTNALKVRSSHRFAYNIAAFLLRYFRFHFFLYCVASRHELFALKSSATCTRALAKNLPEASRAKSELVSVSCDKSPVPKSRVSELDAEATAKGKIAKNLAAKTHYGDWKIILSQQNLRQEIQWHAEQNLFYKRKTFFI